MAQLKILTSKEAKVIKKKILEMWGADALNEYGFLQSSKGKLYIIHHDMVKVDVDSLRMDRVGLYVAEVNDDDIRLSIEGSQLVGPTAKKNMLELTPEQRNKWIAGEDIEIAGNASVHQIIKCGNDFFGTGKLSNGKLYNFFPKSRRIMKEIAK